MGAVGSVAFPEEEMAATEGWPISSLCCNVCVILAVGPKKSQPLLLFVVIPPLPVGLGCSVYQFAEAATKLNIKNVFDAVRAFAHERIKLV